jgi:hypothetical protein
MNSDNTPGDGSESNGDRDDYGSTQPPWRAELEALCELAIEDRLDVRSRDRIEEIVRGDRGACRFYVDYVQQHASLTWAAGRPEMIGAPTGSKSAPAEKQLALAGAQDADAASTDDSESETTEEPELDEAPAAKARARAKLPRAWRIGGGFMSAAAVLLLGLWIGHHFTAKPVIAKLVMTKAAKWSGGSLPTADNADLTAGTLHLAEGVARLKFKRGVEVSLEGPAELQLVSADKCILTSGRLVANVPHNAIGFIVETPAALLKDLGTEFGVSVRGPDSVDVAVFDGLVDVQERSTGKIQQIKEGNTARVLAKQMTVFPSSSEIPPLPPSAADTATQSAVDASRRSVQISDALGRGKDAFILSSGPPDLHAPAGLLQVKNVERTDSMYQRKAYVAFDLAPIAGETIVDARVEFTLIPTAFSSRFPDATFAVYGVTDDSLDSWDEKTIEWDNAPANGPGGAGVDLKKAVLLGRFVVEQGVQQGTFGVEGEALTRFLKNDSNGLVTMVIVRETARAEEKSIIHGFAGRLHPSGAQPTLKLGLRRSS